MGFLWLIVGISCIFVGQLGRELEGLGQELGLEGLGLERWRQEMQERR